MTNDETAIIIGAGPAGLTAAYQLLRKSDIRPIVLEETDRLGGISCTVSHAGNRIDIGGHRLFSKLQPIVDIWTELMPLQGSPSLDDKVLGRAKHFAVSGPDPEKEDNVMLLRDRVSRIYWRGSFVEYPVTLKLATFRSIGLPSTVTVAFGYLWSAFHQQQERSLEDFYINRFGKPLYEMFFESYTQKVWGVHPSEIAPDWGSQRIAGLSLIKMAGAIVKNHFVKKKHEVATSLIEEFYYPKFGPGQLYERMAVEIQRLGGEIRLNSKVQRLNLVDGVVESVATTSGDISADWYLSSMSIKDLIHGMTATPEVIEISDSLPYRDFITVGLLLKDLKIKNLTNVATLNNIVPDCWIYIQDRNVRLARLQIFNNWSPYIVKKPQTTVWVGLEYMCNEGDDLCAMPEQDFIDFAAGELKTIGIIDEVSVLDSVQIKMKKAYPAYFGTYRRFSIVREYLDSIPNLLCIGRNGQHRYNNMDHSMMTAIEAVRYMTDGGTRDEIWNVNTEEAHHEQQRQDVSKPMRPKIGGTSGKTERPFPR